MNGLFILDKPSKIKSKEVVRRLKELLKADKVGHVGTLDPNTTGVLTILVGKATKLSQLLSLKDKTYIATFNLHKPVSTATLKKALKHFTGVIEQRVPKLSAVKRQVRKRKIYYIKLLSLKDRYAKIEVKCQHGTYVRKLIHDLGEYLGVGAHMYELERIQSGPFTKKHALTLQEIENLVKKKDFSFIKQPIEAVKKEAKVYIDEETKKSVSKGSPVFIAGVGRHSKFSKGEIIAIVHKKELIALGIADVDSNKLQGRGIAIKTDLVLI